MILSLKGCSTYIPGMTHARIGYARCSTDEQDLAAQHAALLDLGVAPDRIYTDRGLDRHQPGTGPASTRRWPRSAPATRWSCPSSTGSPAPSPTPAPSATPSPPAASGCSSGASVYDPADPMGKMFFNILATFAEFEVDLLRLRTREGMAIARAKGKLRGKQPKLSDRQQKELRRMHDTGEYSISDLAELFSVSRPTVYRTLARQTPAT